MLDSTFDMLLSLSLNVSGNSVIATDMHAIVQNPTVTPRNDAAKALKGINDIVAFVGGPDFVKVLEDQFNNDDLKDKSLLASINEGIAPVGQAEQKAAASTGYNLITFWGDSNRLTFYYAPPPRTDIPADAAMIGNVRWDPNQFPTANCSSFKVLTDVQTGPRPLLLSDGHSYGVAPTQRVGHFSARPAAVRATLGGGGSCDYTISGLPRKWFHNTSATTTAVPPTPPAAAIRSSAISTAPATCSRSAGTASASFPIRLPRTRITSCCAAWRDRQRWAIPTRSCPARSRKAPLSTVSIPRFGSCNSKANPRQALPCRSSSIGCQGRLSRTTLAKLRAMGP